MSLERLAEAIDEAIRRAGGSEGESATLGDFKFGEIVCRIRSPFPTWRDCLEGRAREDLRMFDDRFQRFRRFLTDEKPDLVVHALADPGAPRLARLAWDALPPPTPGRQVKTFWQEDRCYVVQRGFVARSRSRDREIEVLVAGDRNIGWVDIAMRFGLSQLLTERGGLIFHSAGLVHEHRALVFFGVSGSGKSTIAGLARADAILSDEAVILQKKNGDWYAYGTPFSGSLEYAGDNTSARLAALVKLSKTSANSLRKTSRLQGLAEILKTVIILDDSHSHKNRGLANAAELASDVAIYELGFVPEPQAWDFVLGELAKESSDASTGSRHAAP